MQRRWKAIGLSALLGIGLLASTATQALADERQPTGRTDEGADAPTDARTDIGSPVDPGVDPPYEPGGVEDWTSPDRPTRPTGPGGITSPDAGPGRVDGPSDKAGPDTRQVPGGCIGGKMMDWSYEAQDYLPSYGWRAYVWLFEDQVGGTVAKDGWAPVGPDGEWEWCSHDLVGLGKTFAYSYVAKNQWIELEDNRSYGYDGPFYWPIVAPGLPPDDGGIFLDAPVLDHLDGQLLPTNYLHTGSWDATDDDQDGTLEAHESNGAWGVGDLMRFVMETAGKLDDNGVDPAPNGRHHLYFPSNVCETACFSASTNAIHLPLAQIYLDRYTVQHEIGHAVVDAHWAGSDIGAVGGTHGLNECGLIDDPDPSWDHADHYATSQALRYQEALATFISMWSHTADDGDYDKHPDDPFSAESPTPSCIVTDGSLSEELITGALWDLHDHQADGKDVTGAKDPASVIKFVLAHPTWNADGLRQALLYAMPDHAAWVGGVFAQHKIG